MSADDASSYRPKSPDLSSFFSSTSAEPPAAHNQPHHQPHHHQHPQYQHQQQSPPHHDTQSTLSPYAQNQALPGQQPSHYQPGPQPYDYRPHAQPAAPAAYGYGPPSFAGAPYPNPASAPREIKSEEQAPYLPPLHGLPPTAQPGAYPPHQGGSDIYPPQPQPHYNQGYADPSYQPYAGGAYVPPLTDAPPRPLDMMPKEEEEIKPPRPPPVNLPDPSPVRTKFPTARIKRIMQADEEVGKVAQQTPIAVGKALEMFMVQLVLTSADVAREKGSKRVTAQMLKQVVETDEQWDFLRDIVGKVENNEKAGKAAKNESESEEEEPKKKGKGGRKKKTG
ncbi:histone-like transcription factor (CBF/NF-Y) and archaeal histone domain-containing protein [Sarocladium implicatum]|nr:histone-like transcription factor (CBF/NF-Y) and archaeal histone domain-containing protein [Sarocladium implicatum]